MGRNATALTGLGVLAFSLSARIHAQDHPAAEAAAPSDEIVVTGVRESTLDLPRLLKAQDAFLAGRAAFAPTSSLYFQLRPAPGVALAGMTLFMRSGDRQLPVPIDAEGRFVLPDVSSGKWELVHNRGAGRIAVRALVISAGATEVDRPLGDLRLQCRAGWELAKANYSFVARGGFSAMGGCSSSKFAFYFHTPRPIAVAVLGDEADKQNMPVRADRSAYRAPLGDKAKPNGTMIHIRYS